MATTRRYDELSRKKDEIERSIKEYMDVLQSQKGVGLSEPLVDSEGYPRSDIDVYSCRHARHQISCLQNDHQTVMKEIEEELVRIHQATRELNSLESDMETANSISGGMDVERTPFAFVDRVDSGSPAADGGLQVQDQLLEFGSVNADNFVGLQTIATVLQHSKNKPLRVVVIRNSRLVHLNVTPSSWSGPGLLGCNIKPVK